MTEGRWLGRFSAVLLAMNGTFMFGHDRLEPDQDYFAPYRALGGGDPRREQVQHALNAVTDALLRDYDDPQRFDDFPALSEALHRYGGAPEAEIEPRGRVFAAHDRLGIVSNPCAIPAKALGLGTAWVAHAGGPRIRPLTA